MATSEATKLARRVHERRQERRKYEALAKEEKERMSLYEDAPSPTTQAFYCQKCERDFEAPARKHLQYGYDLTNDNPYLLKPIIAFYIGYCPKQHECRRDITDKWRDPYYRDSKLLKRMRIEHADDLLQPSDPRFKVKYPKQWEELQRKKEEYEAQQQYETDILEGRTEY